MCYMYIYPFCLDLNCVTITKVYGYKAKLENVTHIFVVIITIIYMGVRVIICFNEEVVYEFFKVRGNVPDCA